MDIEGEESLILSDDDDIADEFEALMVGTDLPLLEANSSSFITEIDSISPVDAENMAATLSNNSTSYILLKGQAIDQTTRQDVFISDRYGPNRFYSIMIDTGAAGKSTAGYRQYQAYQRLFGNIQIDNSKEGAVNATFGIGSTKSVGSITIDTPIGQCEFHIVQANTPFLLSITDMDIKGIMLDNLQNKLISSKSNISVPVVRCFGHPFLMWGPTVTTYCYLTETELHILYQRFGHLSALQLVQLLEQASYNSKDSCNHC